MVETRNREHLKHVEVILEKPPAMTNLEAIEEAFKSLDNAYWWITGEYKMGASVN